MVDRSIVVRLRADISDLQAKTRAAAAAVEGVGDSGVKAEGKASGALARLGQTVSKNRDEINTLAAAAGGLGLALGVGVGAAVKSFADFDEAMSHVAASGEDARANMDALRQAAIDAGASTAFSATEAAAGIENLAKAGVSAQDTLGGGLQGALDLAAAGGLGVAEAAETAASALTQFKLQGSDVPHVADLLAAAAGKAQGEVSDMAAALGQSGLVAAQTGLSIEETTGTLAAFASAGLLGSDAGTSFKGMLQSLTPNSAQAAAAMEEIGLQAYDAQGNFIGMAAVAEQLQAGLSKLSVEQQNAALKTIFGSDAVRAASIIYQQGGQGVQDWINKVDDSGFAAETAAARMDNLKGDLEAFRGALDTALIQSGSGANEFLRSMTQDATGLVQAISKIPAPVLSAGTGIAAISAAGLLATAGVGKLAVGLVETRAAMATLATQSPRTASALGAAGKAAGAAAVGFIALQVVGSVMESFQDPAAIAGIESATNALLGVAKAAPDAGEGLDKFFQTTTGEAQFVGNDLRGSIDGIASAIERLSGANGLEKFADSATGLLGMTTAASAAEEGFRQMDAALAAMKPEDAASAFNAIRAEFDAQGVSVEEMLPRFDSYREKLVEQANQLGVTSLSTQDYADWMGGKVPPAIAAAASSADNAGQSFAGLTGATEKQAASLAELVEAAHSTANALLAMRGDEAGMEAAIDAATAALDANGKTLDVNTEKGRANRDALDQIAAATASYTESLAENGASAAEIVAANERGRRSFIRSAVAMGLSKAEARELAGALFDIPKDVKAQVAVPGAKLSKEQADDVNEAIQNIPEETRPKIITIAETQGAKAAKEAIDAVKGKTVSIRTAANLIGVTNVIYALDRLPTNKTVRVTVREQTIRSGNRTASADGRAAGGYISGPGGPTDDVIPAWLSNGEYVVRASAVRAVGIAELDRINAKGYAAGGRVGFAAGGQVGLGDVTALIKLIRAQTDPFADIRDARRLRQRRLRQLEEARDDKREADSKQEKAKAADKLREAEDRAKDATNELKDAQHAYAEQARQASDQLAEPYRSKSTDIDDVLDAMKTGAADLWEFNKQLGQLRKLGLSETVVQQVSSQGALIGSELAEQILAGGSQLVGSLNKANTALQKAADATGFKVTSVKGRYAYGGLISGPGTGTSDSILARVSAGEYVVNARSTGMHLPLLEAINGGPGRPPTLIPAYAAGGLVGAGTRSYRGGDVIIKDNLIVDPDRLLRKARQSQQDAMMSYGLARAL